MTDIRPAITTDEARSIGDDALEVLAEALAHPEPTYVVPNRLERRRARREQRYARKAEERKYRSGR